MMGGYVFTSICLFTFLGRGGGYPIELAGGYPIPGLDGRYSIPGLDGGGTPSHVQMGGTPSQVWMRYPILLTGGTPIQDQDRGYPRVPLPHQELDGVTTPPIRSLISIASTCYTVGSMPLAFTQEDCLVSSLFCLGRA